MADLYLTLRAALAANRLEDFVRQEQVHGAELCRGSDFERAPGTFSSATPLARRFTTNRLRASPDQIGVF